MNDLRAVDLNLLVALDVLLAERSVRGAARRMGISPSAMSHTLARLRALLDDPLLVRAGRQLVPTPRAEALAAPLRDLLTQTRALLAPPDTLDPASLRRALRVVCTDHVSTVLMPRVDARLREDAPGVDLNIVPLTPETMAALRAGTVDAAIGIFPEAPPEIRRRVLFSDRFVTVCRLDHPRISPGGGLDLAAFLRERHALVAPRGDATGLVDRLLAEQGHQRRVTRTFPGFLAALWHAAQGDELLTISARLVAAVADRLPLQVHPPPLDIADYRVALIWHPRQDNDPAARWLRGVVVAAASALGALG